MNQKSCQCIERWCEHTKTCPCGICKSYWNSHASQTEANLVKCGTDDEKLLEDMKKNPSKLTEKGKKVLSIFSQTKPQEQREWEKEFEKLQEEIELIPAKE